MTSDRDPPTGKDELNLSGGSPGGVGPGVANSEASHGLADSREATEPAPVAREGGGVPEGPPRAFNHFDPQPPSPKPDERVTGSTEYGREVVGRGDMNGATSGRGATTRD